MTGNYQLLYQSRGKCGNYRDTGVSNKDKVIHKIKNVSQGYDNGNLYYEFASL